MSQITGNSNVHSTSCFANIKESISICVNGPFWEESTSDWWIPFTNASNVEIYISMSPPYDFVIITQLALRRWANVCPTSTLTLGQRRLANVGLSVGPTVARQRWPNGGAPTSAQRWHTNVGPTLAHRYANGCMPTLYQHWPNEGCVTGFLWGEPIVHRWIPLTKGQERWRWCLPKQSVEQTGELSNRWFETPMWSTSM